ncbi:esterase/lipase family protein [Streptomyces virginiae]|uniref:esterase/lipase family protein n=1 Tax=Streptomyces virginiae TaxID=1961 RepID=UPI0034361654
MIKELVRSAQVLLLALMPLLPTASPAPAHGIQAKALTPDPVVFVHGWNPDSSPWQSMAARLQTDGWPQSHLDQWSYNYTQSNATTAEELAEEIDRVLSRTGATKVDIVTHSMGSLSSRHYLKHLGGADKVDAWVSLAGPNHGTHAARLCAGAPCVEMRPDTVAQPLGDGGLLILAEILRPAPGLSRHRATSLPFLLSPHAPLERKRATRCAVRCASPHTRRGGRL